MPKWLTFQGIRHKYIDDEDGEATLLIKVSMQDKLKAYAIPPKKVIEFKARPIDE